MAADTTGVLIHLEPSQAASKALLEASGGKEPLENQHITLAYLGTLGEEVPDDEVTRDRIMNTVSYVAARYAALNGEANGWGTFHNDGGSVLVALWNIPGINGLRQALVDELRAVGIPVKPNYSYTPHQTMGYYDDSETVPTPGRMESPVKEDFMVLHWNWGEEQQEAVALSGIRREAATEQPEEEAQETAQEPEGTSGGAKYTLLPKDAQAAFEVIQEMGGVQPKTSALHEARDGRDYTRGGNPNNPGQFSKQDQGHRKKDKGKSTKDPKGGGGSGGGGPSAPPSGGGGRTQQTQPSGGGGSSRQEQQDEESFGPRGLSEIMTRDGFSMDDRSGTPPQGGYMLSLDKETEEVFDLADLTPEILEDYYDRHADLIGQPEKFIGAWVDDGKVYLDVSTNMQGAEEEVIAAAEAADQLAIFDVEAGKTVYTSLGGPQADEQGEDGAETQETPSEPVEGYTGVTYDTEADFFTEEQRIAQGDAYGHFLPAGRYAEGDPRNEPEFERKMAEKTELSMKYVAVTKEEIDAGATEGGSTDMLYDHLGPEGAGYEGLWRPERIKVHQEIMARLSETYANYPRGGKAVVMAGPPGAGKSTFLENYGAAEFGIEVKGKDDPKDAPPAKNFVTINPDDFKELLPIDASRYPGLEPNELAFMLHEESSMLAEMATKHFMSQGYNVIIDITLGKESSTTRKYYTPYADSYDYQVALVDGTMNNSLNNAGLRWKKPDRETGVRTYGGRFLPMAVVEANAPDEGSPYRSKNAEQFTKFIGHDRVSRAVVYDPDSASIAEAKADAGVLDWQESLRPSKAITEQSEDDGLAAAARLVKRALSSILVVEGRASRKKPAMRKNANYQVPPEGTEITEKIVSYKEGEIQFTELVDWLTNHTYSPGAEIGVKPGSPEWYEEVENRSTTPGTFAEVVDAVGYGLLTWDEYSQISEAVIQKLGL